MVQLDSISKELETIELLYWSAYYKQRSSVPSYHRSIDGAFIGAVPSVDMLAMNRVIGLGQHKAINIDSIAEITAYYRNLGVKRFMIQLTPQLVNESSMQLLTNAGFYHLNNWTKLVYQVPYKLNPVNSSLTIRKVDRALADLYGEILFMSFDWEDSRLPSWLSATVGVQGYQHYLVYHENKAIAAGALFTKGRFGSLAFAGTLEDFRGYGAQTLLIQTRLRDAQKAGVHYLTSETAEHSKEKPCKSFQNLIANRFRPVYNRQNWCFSFENYN